MDLIAERVRTSRLLGADPDLVLHGGGNTSVKIRHTTVFGEQVEALVVKGSGSDLADIDASGFAWLDLATVRRLAQLDALTDVEMANQLRLAEVRPNGPAPSVEAILHALISAPFVDHTHADAVVTVTNTPAGAQRVAELYGDRVAVVPYIMPGFLLAKHCASVPLEGLDGMVLLNHGIFTWGASAQESYERMLELVGRAAEYVRARRPPPPVRRPPAPPLTPVGRAELRAAVSRAAGAPMVLATSSAAEVAAVAPFSQRGTVTPDHVIRTKPWPLVGPDVEGFVARYRAYFEDHRSRSATPLQPLDPAPRVILDPERATLSCAGRTPQDAAIAEDVYRHTMKVILDAESLGGYEPAPLPDLFDVEYWDLEQAKLRRRPAPLPFAGEVALVTGAASGIGRACAAALMKQGAAVVGLDVSPEIKAAFGGPNWLGLEVDVADAEAVESALDATTARFGGLDILVLNAGVFPGGASIAALAGDLWRRVMAVNLDANLALLRAAHPLLRLAPPPHRGRVVVIGSKNVPAPGPGAAAYSASKAGLTQLARVAALEWGGDGVRVNVIHPNAVFDTGVWSDQVLAERAARYGLSVDEYRASNVLGVEVESADVARLCVAMCGPPFAKTTGAQVPVDGGNERVI